MKLHNAFRMIKNHQRAMHCNLDDHCNYNSVFRSRNWRSISTAKGLLQITLRSETQKEVYGFKYLKSRIMQHLQTRFQLIKRFSITKRVFGSQSISLFNTSRNRQHSTTSHCYNDRSPLTPHSTISSNLILMKWLKPYTSHFKIRNTSPIHFGMTWFWMAL